MNIYIKSFIASIVAVLLTNYLPAESLNGFSVGEIKLMCNNRGSWKIELGREKDNDGVEYAVVKMTSPTEEFPPAFNLSFNMPKLDIVASWRPWSHDGEYGMYWNLAKLPGAGTTHFCRWMPLFSCYSSGGHNRFTFAASESSEPITMKAGIREENNRLYFSFHYYDQKITKRKNHVAYLRIDSRNIFWSDSVMNAAAWMTKFSGRKPAFVPDSAFEPLYSTWYSFHQNVFAPDIELECELASKMGMKTIIVDDGWQTDDTNRGYAFCGDWAVSKRRFPDFKSHVEKVHAMGMKYMIWYSVPFLGEKSKNLNRFKGMTLYHIPELQTYCLDPRFPEVREFLISTYEKAVREWDIDGVKLDFIDSFNTPQKDPAFKDNFKGRDIKSVTEATELLISDIYKRLSAIKKDILIEFRQAYIGPSIRAAANMLRAGDCPADMHVNRIRVVNLRLTSGKTAVHSDMLEWHPEDTPEAAAKNILSVIFSTVQYSMKLSSLSKSHIDMIRHWSLFGAQHIDALQKGSFRAYHPELSYPLLEGESAKERIFGVYAQEIAIKTGPITKDIFILNGTDADSLIVETPAAAKVSSYDTFGKKLSEKVLEPGIHRMPVKPSGYLNIKRN